MYIYHPEGQNISLIILISDAPKIARFYNIITKFGWHSGEGIEVRMRELLDQFTGNPDLTFEQVCPSFFSNDIVSSFISHCSSSTG
jgi:hypothetical protein